MYNICGSMNSRLGSAMYSISLVLAIVFVASIFQSCYASPFQAPFTTQDSSHAISVPLEAWQKLNESVDGRLLVGLPVGLPCYNNFNGKPQIPNIIECGRVFQNQNSTDYLVTQASGYCQGNWGVCQFDNSGCPTSPKHPIVTDAQCNQGAIAPYFLNVSSVLDVQKALAFADEYNYPIVVKNSGHDYKGRSAAPNALAIWVHNYAPSPIFQQSFTPDSCTEAVGDVITFGTGQGFDGLYEFVNQHGTTVIGGSANTVAPAGGWIGGGGHSALSPVYGLGVDNVQQIRVVLPNGTYVTANHCQNKDIFFALRGGGGGTFGVNMEMSVLAHKSTPVQFAVMVFPAATNQKHLLSILVENANTWFDEGWGGYAYPGGTLRDSFPVQMMNPRLTKAEAEASLKPLLDFATSLGVSYRVTTYDSFFDLYAANIRNSSLRQFGNYGLAQTSRLIPRANFEGEDNQKAIVDAMLHGVGKSIPAPMSLMLLLTTPTPHIKDRDSSLTPAWRNATWHVIYTTMWDPASTTAVEVQNKFRAVTYSMDPLRDLTPGAGAYLNEGDTYEPDPVTTFWGRDNHARLVRIKEELDPKSLMVVHQGIGSEKVPERFYCYPQVRDVPSQAKDELR